MSNIYKLIVSIFFISTMFSGCGAGGNEGSNSVGDNLVSGTVIEEIDASTMLSVIKNSIDENATNAFAYKAIKIVYKTTNIKGKEVNASGLLIIPQPTDAYKAYLKSLDKTFSISLICENHGTIFTNSEAPSVSEVKNGQPDSKVGVLMTGLAGFAVAMPDYLGYGDSKGETHPYILKKSAEASLDMTRASVRYMIDHGYLYNGQLYISGYSEGGYVAMALAKDIEENHSDEFKLKGVAPMAGPYNLEGQASYELNATKKMVFPAFLAFLADSYSKFYDDISIEDLVVKPEVFNSVNLFGGDYNSIMIHSYLGLADVANGDYGFNTHFANELFKDSFISRYHSDENSPTRVRFRENSVYDWTPNSKIHLIQCTDDEIIPYLINTKVTYDTFVANGADVKLTPIPTSLIPDATATNPFVHSRCGATSYGVAVKWFNELRSGGN